MVLFFPCFVFADKWAVVDTNKSDYQLVLQETDIIDIKEGEFLMIYNAEKRQYAVIVIPGEKTVGQGIEEAKKMEQERTNAARKKYHLGEPLYLLYKYSVEDIMFFWMQN
jgi:hypothetical protein